MTRWPHQSASTQTARVITRLAEQETLRFGHYQTGPEHFLLAIIKLEDDQPCLAAAALRTLLGNLRAVRLETENRMESQLDMRTRQPFKRRLNRSVRLYSQRIIPSATS